MEGTHAVPMRVLRWSAVLNACVASCTQMVLTYAPNMHLLNACCMPHAGITLGSRENLMSETVHTLTELLPKPVMREAPLKGSVRPTAGPYCTASG